MSLVLKLLTIWAEQKRLETDLSQCSRHRYKNNTCSKCLDICPSQHAIQLESIPKWNADHCLECMHCTVVCPTQVFQDKRYKEILNSINNRKAVRFSCEKRGSKVHDVRLPCLFQLELLHLLLAGEVTNHIHVCLDKDTCKDCPLYRDDLEGDVHAVVNAAREIFMITGSSQNLHVVERLDNGTVGEQTISRRDFLSKVISKTSEEARSLLPSFPDERTLRDGIPVPEKRNLLYHLLLKRSGNVSKEMYIPYNLLNAVKIKVSDACNYCGKCSAICPTGSLRLNEQNGSEMLSQQLMDCLDCGLCKEVCEEQALTYEEGIWLQEFCCSDPIPINKRMMNKYELSKEEIDSYFS